MSENKVTVIIPVEDWAPFVLRALDSVIIQGEIVNEVLLIDNSLSAPTVEILSCVEASPITRIVKSDIVQDAARARNIGIDNSFSEFIAVLDSDDEYHSNHLNVAIDCLQKNNADFYCCAYINKQEDGIKEIRRPDEEVTVSSLLDQSNIGHSTVVYRSELNIRYPEIGRRHDFAAWLQLFSFGQKYVSNNEVYVTRHKRPNSFSSKNKFHLLIKQIWVTYKFSTLGFIETSFRLTRMLFRTGLALLLKKMKSLSIW